MSKLQILKSFSSIFLNNSRIVLLANKPSLFGIPGVLIKPELDLVRCLNYKRSNPTNKVFSPSTVPVSDQNRHLLINLLDKNEESLGKMSLDEANKIAKGRELKLVMINNDSPPEFKLMTGADLYQLQMKHKTQSGGGGAGKELKEKEVDINLGIEEHDLEIKLKMIKQFYEKGHPIKIKIRSRIMNKNEKNIAKLQQDFVERVKNFVTFAKVEVGLTNEKIIMLSIEAASSQSSSSVPENK